MILTLAAAETANAQLETLVMPGEVVEAHAEHEENCDACHAAFERSRQRELCLDCHEEVAADITEELGFHGKHRRARRIPCARCHTDHEGRDADIVELDEDDFDHDLTDFLLSGKHVGIACSNCHEPDTRHRDAPSACFACHEADNPHGQTLGTQCGDCHTPNDWMDFEFDHDTTGYPLIGKHQGPKCLDCHADDTFTNTPTTCFGCHADDDAHNGRSGNQCGDCHSPVGWDDTRFDHQRDTRFALVGKHSEQSCDACHSADPFSDSLSMDCVSCHRDDDKHDGHFGSQCDTCHEPSGWSAVQFDHAIDTGHALNGGHATAECTACHVEPIFDVALQTDCLSCHEDDDPHSQSLGIRCNDCHNELTWEDDVFFDHDLTRFPLLGKHSDIDCGDCHDSHVFRDASEQCVDCHTADDTHDGRFGTNCATCHNPVDWQQWFFDHNRQTSFALDGAHAEVACESCHRRPLSSHTKLGRYCADCHQLDDIHNGEFGPDCAQCHSAESFRDVRSLQ